MAMSMSPTLQFDYWQWVVAAVAIPIATWAAWPFYERAVASVRMRALNMFTLIGLGVSVAYGFSIVAAVAPGIFPASLHDAQGHVPVYLDRKSTRLNSSHT